MTYWSDIHRGIDSPGISVDAVRAYLRDAGWQRELVPTELPVQFWARGRDEVMVPLNLAAPDFDRRWRDLVTDLAKIEDRAPDDVGRDLSTAQYDVLELRAAEHGAAGDFTISLADGVDLVSNAKAMMISAACSTLDRRSYHGKSRPKAALDQARTVRMGQTRRGSYVIPIISPVLDRDTVAVEADELTLLPDVERQLFPRRVMITLAGALASVHDLAARSSEPSVPELTEAVVRQGLSAELCTAVANMTSARDVAELDVGVRWSLIASPPADPVRLEFSADAASPVRRLGERLRDQVTVRDRLIYGVVTSLDRDPEDDVGTVTVRAMVGPRSRPIKMILAEQDYQLANRAHMEKRRIVVSGNLINVPGRTLQMTGIRFLQLDHSLATPVDEEDRLR